MIPGVCDVLCCARRRRAADVLTGLLKGGSCQAGCATVSSFFRRMPMSCIAPGRVTVLPTGKVLFFLSMMLPMGCKTELVAEQSAPASFSLGKLRGRQRIGLSRHGGVAGWRLSRSMILVLK